MAELGSAFAYSGHNSWTQPRSRLLRDEQESLINQLTAAVKTGRVYDLIQPSLRILSSDHHYNEMIHNLRQPLYKAFSNFDRLNNGIQGNDVVALTEAFAVACYRGQLDDVRRLSHVVCDDVNMMGVGLHFALLQHTGRCSKEHWDIIKWLMDNTRLRDNPLVLRRAFVEACEYKEFKEVRWLLQYGELAQDTQTIDYAIRYTRRSRHLALIKCLVEHTDVDLNRMESADPLLHDVIWMNERCPDLHYVCLLSRSVAADVNQLVDECGANVNEQDNNGNTPLHVACFLGHQDIVQVLMSSGADVNITNNWKRTPAQEAFYHGHKELLPLMDRTRLMDI